MLPRMHLYPVDLEARSMPTQQQQHRFRVAPSQKLSDDTALPTDGRGIRIYGRCSSSWCPIQYNGVQGWANGYYLMKE
jgi:hypothetical protein